MLTSPPSSFSYDNQGKIQIPEDYPHATEFKQLLEKNPTLEHQISIANALASHVASINKSLAFHQEYSVTKTKAEAKAIVDKYSYLFSDQQQHNKITMGFSAEVVL